MTEILLALILTPIIVILIVRHRKRMTNIDHELSLTGFGLKACEHEYHYSGPDYGHCKKCGLYALDFKGPIFKEKVKDDRDNN